MKYNSILHYPLDWPLGFARTREQKPARFKKSFAEARQHCEEQLVKLGASQIIFSTNLVLNHLGSVKAWSRQPQDTGVAVYFEMDGADKVFCCDAWDCVEDNLRALGLTFEAMRGIDRWGASDIMARSFQGFAALPESTQQRLVRTWWRVLGVKASATPDEIKAAIRQKSFEHHPDRGGDREHWDELQLAISEADSRGKI